ncbi:PCGF2 protein, partial [Acromyrmex insinuator]
MEAKEREKPLVKDLNEHIVCPLCRGYLIDATTLVECLHSFCRGCIVRRLSSGARACPVCSVATSPPLLPDMRLQRLVYLAVPGLFRSELERRCHFRLVNPQCPPLAPPVGALELTLDDLVSLSLQELEDTEDEIPKKERGSSKKDVPTENKSTSGSTRYLKCPAAVTVRHLVRLLMLKRGWEEANATVNGIINRIKILYQKHETQHPDELNMYPLDPSWTLLDLACIFQWKREAPMKLFYRVLRKDGQISISKVPAYKDDVTKDVPPAMENIQRPPTPPPSPKPNREHEEEARNIEPPRALETNVNVRDKEIKTKKPRCEVTPVMRTPDPPSTIELSTSNRHRSLEKTKNKDMARLEHRKRHKRHKRVIAEITTVPREDLLKLKVRLTPRPPRITSGTTGGGGGGSGGGANNQTKEKLLQMRAVRRDKLKAIAVQQRSPTSPVAREETKSKECVVIETEETIEEIIDSIPDEVVRIAQNINNQNEETKFKECSTTKKINKEVPERTKTPESSDESENPKKDEEILRRLGLVAVNEASGDRMAKQRTQSGTDKVDNLNHDKLEKQLRENKANRVRSLLAEKKMRDALKTIISKKEELTPSVIKTPASVLTSVAAAVTVATPVPTAPVTVPVMPKMKEPPPLTPIRVAKSSSFAATSVIVSNITSKYETPLDLSSGGTTVNDNDNDNDNVLDLSATLPGGNHLPSFSSSSLSSLTSSSSSLPLLSKLSARSTTGGTVGTVVRKSKELEQQRGKGQQESNLKTLSDVAVSRMSSTEKNSPVESLTSANVNAAANKVALRIPQPHHRISGFGMKSKPNLGVRHIPNPQVVVSQYRNQKLLQRNYYNIVQKP